VPSLSKLRVPRQRQWPNSLSLLLRKVGTVSMVKEKGPKKRVSKKRKKYE